MLQPSVFNLRIVTIFLDNKDRENLSRRLGELLPATKASCYVYPVQCEAYLAGAWAMLSNHAHFLLRTGTTGLLIVKQEIHGQT